MLTRHPAAALNRRYITAWLCIAALIVMDEVLVKPELTRLASDAPVINIAGRQRMLSQQLAKTALILRQPLTAEERARRRNELNNLTELWSRSHQGLQRGDTELQLPGNNPPPIQAAFAQLDTHFLQMRNAANVLLNLSQDATHADMTLFDEQIGIILQHEQTFLIGMDRLVKLYEEETRKHVVQLEQTSWSIAATILAMMWLLHSIAIRPATRLLEKQYVETQDQYSAVIGSINEGLLQLDRYGKVLYASEQFCTLSGRTQSELTGWTVRELFQELSTIVTPADSTSPASSTQNDLVESDQLPQLLLNTNEVATSANSKAEKLAELELMAGERFLLHPTQQARPCWVSPCQIKDDAGQTTGWVVLVMDVSEQRASQQRAQSLIDQLAHADRLKSMGEIAAGIAHEVNQPLGAISNFTEGCLVLIHSGKCEITDLEVPLQRILRSALRAGGITRRVKQFSQLRPHTLAIAELNSLVQEMVELLTMEFHRRQVQCELHLSPIPLPLECDALQISQVLTNLLQNAMHALGEVPVHRRIIVIETFCRDSGQVHLIVRDHGTGFPEEMRDRMFKPFNSGRPDGLGIGLSITRSIVEAHGGAITAENWQQGAEVIVVLPKQQPRQRVGLPLPGETEYAK